MTQTAIEKLSFEDALGELETIVRNLETGQTKLDESIASTERGVALKHCKTAAGRTFENRKYQWMKTAIR